MINRKLFGAIAAAAQLAFGASAFGAGAHEQYPSVNVKTAHHTQNDLKADKKHQANGIIAKGTTANGTTREKQVHVENNLIYENNLEVPQALDNEVRFVVEQAIRTSPLPHIARQYEENRGTLRFSLGRAAHVNTPDNLVSVVAGFFDENANGLWDKDNKEPLLGIPNNTFEGMTNSPALAGAVSKKLRDTYTDMLDYRVLASGVVKPAWHDSWFQDMTDYTPEQKSALVDKILGAVAQGMVKHKDYLSARIVNDFTEYFGALNAPKESSGSYKPIVFQANTGDWYLAVFRDDDSDGTADVNEPFLNSILEDGISAFMKIDAPDCPTIVGRGPSCPEKANVDDVESVVGVNGTAVGAETTLPAPENPDALSLEGAMQVAVMGNVTEALNKMPYRSGDVTLSGRVSLGKIYTALKIGGWWRESHNANDLHQTVEGKRVPLEGVPDLPVMPVLLLSAMPVPDLLIFHSLLYLESPPIFCSWILKI